MSLNRQNYFELIMAVLISASVLVGCVLILASLGGCGGSDKDTGVVPTNTGSNAPACDVRQDGCCPTLGGLYVCDPGFVDGLRDSVRQLEDDLGVAEESLAQCQVGLESTGDALSACQSSRDECAGLLGVCTEDLYSCHEELGECPDELGNCEQELADCICTFSNPGEREGWYKYCSGDEA